MEDINNSQLPPIQPVSEPLLPPLQAPLETQIISPINYINVEKPKSGIKNIIKYLFIFYLLIILAFVSLILLNPYKHSTGWAALGSLGYLMYIGGLFATVISVINFFITKKFIKNNFDDTENTKVNKIFILKFFLVLILFQLIIYSVRSSLSLIETGMLNRYYIYYYLFYLLFIPLSLFSLQKEYFNKKTIYLCILLLFIPSFAGNLIPLLSSGINNIDPKGLLLWIPAILANVILVMLPFTILSFYLLKIKEEKNKGKKTSIIILIIAIIFTSILLIRLNYYRNKIFTIKTQQKYVNFQNY